MIVQSYYGKLDPFKRSAAQQIAMAIVPKVTGAISFTSSVIMVYMILQSDIKLGTSYRRLIFAICSIDILQSLMIIISTWASPKDSQGIWGAHGNDTTCSITGAIFQFASNASPMYVASLCIHYFFFVQYKIRKAEFCQKVEPWLHAVPIVWNLSTTVFLLATNHINQADVVCWIAPYPYNCITEDEIDCIRGSNSHIYRWVFNASGNIISLNIITALMFKIYMTVKKRDDRLDAIEERAEGEVSVAVSSVIEKSSIRENIQNPFGMRRTSVTFAPQQRGNDDDKVYSNRLSSKGDESNKLSPALPYTSTPELSPRKGASTKSKQKEMKALQDEVTRKLRARSREAMSQAFLFSSFFMITNIWVYVLGALEAFGVEPPFVARICLWIFYPLHGLSTVFAFTRPHVTKLRRTDSSVSYLEALWKVIKSGGDVSIRTIRASGRRQIVRSTGIKTSSSIPQDDDNYNVSSSANSSKPPSRIGSSSKNSNVVSSLGFEERFDEDFDISIATPSDAGFGEDDLLYGDDDKDIYDDISFAGDFELEDRLSLASFNGTRDLSKE